MSEETYEEFMEEVKMIWGYAIRSGYFDRYPKQCMGWGRLDKQLVVTQDWKLPAFVGDLINA